MACIFETSKDTSCRKSGGLTTSQVTEDIPDANVTVLEQGLCQRLTEQDILHNCQRRLLTLQTVFYVMAIIVLIKWLFKH